MYRNLLRLGRGNGLNVFLSVVVLLQRMLTFVSVLVVLCFV